MPVPLAAVLHADPEAAAEALRALGAEPDARLDLVHEVPGFGTIARRFGTLCNPLTAGPVADRRLLDELDGVLASPKNAALRARPDPLPFCPVNKTMARALAADLLSGLVHL